MLVYSTQSYQPLADEIARLAPLLAAGASAISAVVTHCLLPGDSLARLQQRGLFQRLVVTDSHPRARALENGSGRSNRSRTLLQSS